MKYTAEPNQKYVERHRN